LRSQVSALTSLLQSHISISATPELTTAPTSAVELASTSVTRPPPVTAHEISLNSAEDFGSSEATGRRG